MAQTTKIYANTLAKYNEGKLLSEEKLRRLADADFVGAVKMLCDYGYGGGRLGENSFDVDRLISEETVGLINFISEGCFDPHTTAVLLARFYYNNAKARYKFKVGGQESVGALYDMDSDFTSGIPNGTYADCPEPMAKALSQLDAAALTGKVSAMAIDEALTRAMYADMSAHAKKAGRAVKRYVAAKIDFVNLTSALRLLRMEAGSDRLKEIFIEGGGILCDDLTAAYEAGLIGFADKLRDTQYYDILKRVSEKGFDALPLFETDAAYAETTFFDGDLENMLSSAPLLHYYASALNEYKTVKIILTCLKNNVRGEINRRVRWS